MPYIGKSSDGFGIRERYRFSASGGQTDFTSTDLDSKTLQIDNGSLVDVYLNGVLLDTADYNTNTANQVSLTSGASASDEVMIVVYDVFSLSDAMPKTGGTFTGGITGTTGTFSDDLTVDTNKLKVDISSKAVGIGTASPHIENSGDTQLDVRSDGTYAFFSIGKTATITSGEIAYMEFMNGNNNRMASIAGGADGANNDGYMRFSTLNAGSYTEAMRINHDQIITMPLQSSFLATFTSANTNIALNSAVHQYFDAEVYDINGDYGSNTFTAPVTGKYLLQARVRVDSLPTDPAYIWFYIQTSNRVHTVDFFDPDNFDGGGIYYTAQGTVIADMDKDDTATFNIHQSGGTQQTDMNNGHFSGHLLG